MSVQSSFIIEALNVMAPTGGGKPTGADNANWFDLTSYVRSQQISNLGFLGPRSGNIRPAQMMVTLKNDASNLMPNGIGLASDVNTNITTPGNRIRMRVITPSQGYCMKVYFDSSVTGVAGASDIRQTVTQAVAAAQTWTLSWSARAQWDSEWNTDNIFIATSAETQTVQVQAYTNKWATYSITFVTTAIATTIAACFRPVDLNTTGTKQPYRYIEYDNISLSCPAVSGGANILTNGAFSTGALTPWAVTTATTGSYVAAVQRDSLIKFNGFIDTVNPMPFSLSQMPYTVLNCIDFPTALLRGAKVDLALQFNQKPEALLKYVFGLLPTNPVANYYNAVQVDAPIRYYRLGDASGTVLADSSATAQNATPNTTGITYGSAGALTTTADTNGSITLDGATGFFNMPSLSTLTSNSFTFEAWIYPTAAPAAYSDIFGMFTANTLHNAFTLKLNNNLSLTASFVGDDQVGTAAKITLNTWNHIAVTFDATVTTTSLYVNGVLDTSGAHGPMSGATPVSTVGWSGVDTAATHTFQGRVDEVAIYEYPLTVAQLLRRYNNGITFATERQKRWIPGFVYDVGYNTFPVAFDGYTRAGNTDVLKIVDDIVDSEYGDCWFDTDGTFRFGNWAYKARKAAVASSLTLDGSVTTEPFNMVVGADPSYIVNRVNLTYKPRQTVAGTIVLGKSTGSVNIASKNGDGTPGVTPVTLTFTDPNGGRTIAGTNVILPLVAGTDIIVNEKSDNSGVFYSSSPYFRVIVASLTASELQLKLLNYATGQLFANTLQVRGTGVYAYNPNTVSLDVTRDITNDNANSLTRYRDHTFQRNFAFTTDTLFLNSLATYYISQYSEFWTEAQRLIFNGTDRTNGGVDLFGLEIYDSITISDARSGLSNVKHFIKGINYDLAPGGAYTISLELARADVTKYNTWDNFKWDDGTHWYI